MMGFLFNRPGFFMSDIVSSFIRLIKLDIHLLLICIPATLLGSLLGAISVMWKGPELKDDPDYQERLAKGLIEAPASSPNVSQGGGERAKSSSIRRRSELNLRKSSYGPSPAGLLAVLAPSVSIFCQGKTHHSPNSACCPNSSRYSLPFSQQRRAVTCNCRYTWRNSSR